MLKLSSFLGFPHAGAVMTGIVTFAMCYQSKIKYFTFIPGTFMGCFTTCAANGNWQGVLPSMLLGAVLGVLCESTGKWLYEKLGNKEKWIL
ncbi:Putative Glutathione-regulated potassium-efflux system protein [Clostridium chauvoei JF4335]|nr:Putative Glutathione-regulated potassium-efflux system protein [Clostridium chauvoei JF4335]